MALLKAIPESVPESIRSELIAQREVGSDHVIFKVLRVYQPAGLGERTADEFSVSPANVGNSPGDQKGGTTEQQTAPNSMGSLWEKMKTVQEPPRGDLPSGLVHGGEGEPLQGRPDGGG